MTTGGVDGDDEQGGGEEAFTALEIARKYDHAKVVSLLKDYLRHPEQSRHQTGVALRVHSVMVDLFATILLSDGYFVQKLAGENLRASRFFAISKRMTLFLELAQSLFPFFSFFLLSTFFFLSSFSFFLLSSFFFLTSLFLHVPSPQRHQSRSEVLPGNHHHHQHWCAPR